VSLAPVNVVLMAAMGSEVGPLERALPGVKIVGTGVGKVAAAANTTKTILLEKPDAIVFVGVAGGLAPDLKTLSVVIASEAAQWDVDLTVINGTPHGTLNDGRQFIKLNQSGTKLALEAAQSLRYDSRIGRIVSGDVFLADPAKAKWIRETFQADAVEMEGAAALQVADDHGVPMVLIRVISDGAGDDAAGTYTNFMEAAAERAASVVAKFLPAWLEHLRASL
jgi:5'-methylthioadenosine/S-adenosylhomocysteine nucleosidase